MIKQHEVHPWVKRLGQYHLYKAGESKTLCGTPMLGNNYAIHVPEHMRKACEKCFALARGGEDDAKMDTPGCLDWLKDEPYRTGEEGDD